MDKHRLSPRILVKVISLGTAASPLNSYLKHLSYYRGDILNDLQGRTDFVNQVTPTAEIEQNFHQIASVEVKFKKDIESIMSNEEFSEILTTEVADQFTHYLSKQLRLFSYDKYYENNLQVLFQAMASYYSAISQHYFNAKKELLAYQANLHATHNLKNADS